MSRWEKLEKKPAPMFTEAFGALTGIRVLLNGSVVAAPFAATMLSDFGAEVIALERPKTKGDPARHQMPQVWEGDAHISGAWAQNARNKLSFALETNFKKVPESKEIFFSLIKECDVWIENIVWIEKLGLTDEMLLKVNPKLIICHVSGFGTPGFGGETQYLNRACYDPLAQAESGWCLLQGFPDKPPYYAQQYIGDYLSGMFAVNGILMALCHVEKTGKGQVVDATLVESFMRVMDDNFVLWDQESIQKQRQGVKQLTYQPAGIFETKDGKFINLGTYGKGPYEKVMKAFGFDLDKYSYEAAGGSAEALQSLEGKELDQMFADYFISHTADEAIEVLLENKLGAAVIKDCQDVMGEKHWQERGDWVTYHDQTLDKDIVAFGFAPKLSETPGKVWRGAPRLGQDMEAIMTRLLDYTPEEIEAMRGKGIID
ncbi:CoA-transferase family III protein [Pseudoramibacter alactolyticus ATCC 23263]|uniref:CoA-transferase family III protein n=1 Tax=Pseudoramibacter alactolyticus ATCC 23263 TaxID=887929 RepID=E6MIZ7_9FIRM|nr:CoA transferase [Pseudoramibacter alactolyticus]EFV00949.1 CoA-transferase family III protein [Pseudoramibacter alactolyticus ATCC 23263]